MTGTGLALAQRTGLPDALRVLVEKHPRLAWEAHPNFSALTRFWLDRHLGFRRMQAQLVRKTEGFLDRQIDPRGFVAALSRLAGPFISELHGHHHIEDQHYFPLLAKQDARLGRGFALLDRDHQAIDPLLQNLVERINAVLRGLEAAGSERTSTEALRADLTGFGRLLDRHLTDEEELVVPVILEYAPRELG